MKFPILYKKTSTGAIQYWTIESVPGMSGMVSEDVSGEIGFIETEYGQLGTTSPQKTTDEIKEGKNIGKANETGPWEQADKEAKAKWEKQKKKGYVESIEAAQAEELDEIIEGGVVPMFAHKFAEQGHKIKYPCLAQPKLDGIRCIAIVKDGACTLWSRTRKQITSMPHIVQELEAIFENRDVTFDGEIYNHEYKSNFEKIVSLVRQEEPDPEHYIVQYHIYDIVSEQLNNARMVHLGQLFWQIDKESSLKLVETVKMNTEDDVMPYFDRCRARGYEGAMLRNIEAKYVNKRSYDLQKVKEFDDAEFPIVRVEEGRGKLAGHAIFVCRTESGKEFLAKMRGETSKLKEFFDNHSLWQGKRLTVQYQGITGAGQVPRFPVGVAIRDYE